ncbi:heme NO-binding domain-containing protein [Natrinema hispanicum]|uniref:Haem-NO-binding n=1 Tax=Natrinema hispanicum TaxID=392421 RepID=A0A1G6RVX8_9EURY|nr:heme NO-binding domain-containing protein [Natrinema hispanicum]SDD08096.1 Haem-NO-binding [Natrinema hispanicum]SET76704.1 Haem-NO-binding [Natrinema hispanicum]
MHGLVHKTLKEYVVDQTDDAEIDAILETLSGMATQDRRAIERDVGRTLAPDLLSTFSAHVSPDWEASDLLAELERVYDDVETATDDVSLPAISSRHEFDHGVVTYETHRDTTYCGMAHGVLEGVVAAFDGDATVTETACVDDEADKCRFRVDLE